MHFDWEVNIGGIISFVGLVIVLLRLHRSNVEREKGNAKILLANAIKFDRLEQKVTQMYRWWERQIGIDDRRRARDEDEGRENNREDK